MINTKIEKELNSQLNKETFSAYLYMSMAAYFQSEDLVGFSNWMSVQAKEEMTHAEKFYNFVHEREGKIVLEQIDKPQTDWKSPLEAFEAALEHERFITASINNIVDSVITEKDHATNIFLQWFVTEQIEEEASVTEVIKKLKFMKDAPGGLYMLDKELGARVFTPPAVPA